MSFEPSDVMVQATADYLHARTGATPEISRSVARAALEAAFAAAVEAGEAREGTGYECFGGNWQAFSHSSPIDSDEFHCLILRKPQEGEK